jgi:hypothetical protein
MEQLILTKCTGYEVTASDDEWNSSSKGIFKNAIIANAVAETAGWYDSKGNVNSIVLYTDGKQIYKVSEPFQYRDVKEDIERTLKESIMSKLTSAEKEFLKLK